MMDGEASVVSSSKGQTVAILSNNLLSASFSIVVELPRLLCCIHIFNTLNKSNKVAIIITVFRVTDASELLYNRAHPKKEYNGSNKELHLMKITRKPNLILCE